LSIVWCPRRQEGERKKGVGKGETGGVHLDNSVTYCPGYLDRVVVDDAIAGQGKKKGGKKKRKA